MLPSRTPSSLFTHLLFFILFLCSSLVLSQQACNQHDQSALLAFSENISTSLSPPLNWSSHISCCQWEGIECDLNGRVTHLHLPSRSLKGVIFTNSSISRLVMLTHLNLSSNHLHGSLEDDISSLTNLRVMDISSNSIVGSIPQGIGKLLNLEILHLYNNNISGHIPPSLMNCTKLVEIILRLNRLKGDFSKLDFSKLVQLQKIDFLRNNLSGTLPESIYSCKSLVAIRIAENVMGGQISPKLASLKSLSFLSISRNNYTNITSALEILAKCKNLTTISLSYNFYGETLPVQKNFLGPSDFPNLQFLSLAKCDFEATPIPYWLSTLKNLRILTIRGNKFTGQVPNGFGTLPKLFALDLSNNSLSGELPRNLWKLRALISERAQEDLEYSEFELPIFIVGGTIRIKTSYYHGLYLSNNAFIGKIPDDIGRLQNLQELFLEDNQFSGHIPSSVSNLRKLEKLGLSINNLTGEIPTSLASLNFLSYFNVSYNDLEGPIPNGGQFGSFEKSFFEGNPGLCGELLKRSCSSAPTGSEEIESNESDDKSAPFLNGMLVGFASGFSSILMVVGSYFWFNYCKRRQPSSKRR